MRASLADGASDRLAFVAAQIVEHHDVAGPQRRYQELHHPREKNGAVNRAVDDARRGDAIGTQRGKEGHGHPVAVRHAGEQALAPRCPAMSAGHVGLGPGLERIQRALFHTDAARCDRRKPRKTTSSILALHPEAIFLKCLDCAAIDEVRIANRLPAGVPSRHGQVSASPLKRISGRDI